MDRKLYFTADIPLQIVYNILNIKRYIPQACTDTGVYILLIITWNHLLMQVIFNDETLFYFVVEGSS